MPFWWSERLTVETFLYTALLVIIAALMIGGIPALKATGPRDADASQGCGRGLDDEVRRTLDQRHRPAGRVYRGVHAERRVAGVDHRTPSQQQYNDVAFERRDYLVAQFAPNTDARSGRRRRPIVEREEFLRRLREAPAVANATYTDAVTRLRFWLALNTSSSKTVFSLRVSHIGPDFFETFNRAVRSPAGSFTPTEIESGAKVAVVDESFVRFVLGGRSAVGQQVREVPDSGAPGEWIEIVGVTSDISTSARKTIKDAQLYLADWRDPATAGHPRRALAARVSKRGVWARWPRRCVRPPPTAPRTRAYRW